MLRKTTFCLQMMVIWVFTQCSVMNLFWPCKMVIVCSSEMSEWLIILLVQESRRSSEQHLPCESENLWCFILLKCHKKTAVFTAVKKHPTWDRIFRSLQWCMKARKFQQTAENKWQKGNIHIYINKTFKFIHLINILYVANEGFNSL